MNPRLMVLLLLLAAAVPAARARINVVTLPGRDTVQLTIYNSADLTMVRETRHLTFRKGLNRLEFSWANTLIDPTSVEFRPVTHGDRIEVLDVRFPPNMVNLLEWRIESEVAGEVEVEIRYFTSGIAWSADYVVEAAPNEEQMALAGAVRVSNRSGEDYENAQVRLVVGTIHLVDEIAELARRGRPGEPPPVPMAAPMNRPEKSNDAVLVRRMSGFVAMAESVGREREIVKEGLSEYFLYTVEGRDTIPTGWSKRLPSFRAEAVPMASFYKFEQERWGDGVMRYYRFKNDAKSKLGKEPLPDGRVQAFRVAGKGGEYAYIGGTAVKYIPVDEQVDLELGMDPEVRVEPVLMNFDKFDIRRNEDGNVVGWTTRETWKIEVQNSRDIPVGLDIRRNFGGDWTLATKETYEKVDADTIKFSVPLKPREQRVITYDLETRHGINVQR